MYYLIILAVLALDQITKILIDTNLVKGDSIPVIENIFHITYVQNTGAAFSMLQGERVFLIAFPAVVMAVMFLFLIFKCKKEHWTLKLALALIISGGVGNLIDRAVRGFVVDFFDFRVWPVFNVADIAVCVGCGLLILNVLFFDKKDKKEKADGKKDSELRN